MLSFSACLPLSSLHTPPPPPVAHRLCLQCGGHRATEEAGQRLRSWQRQWGQETRGTDKLSFQLVFNLILQALFYCAG